MEELERTVPDDTGTISGNDPGDIPPAEETPPENGDGTGRPADQPEEPEKPADGSGQAPGNDMPDPGKEDKEDAPAVITDDDSGEWAEDVTERLAELMEPEDNADITERLDALIALLTPEELTEEAETGTQAIPVEGYDTFGYPVKVEYAVLFAGYEEYITETETYDAPEIFAADYEDFVYECSKPGSSFKDFYINCIYDADGSIVYALQVPEPDTGEEEEPEPADLLLSHLEGINTTLSGMVQADAAYCRMVKDYQTEMLEMQAVSTATDIIIATGVFAIFGAMVFQQFLGRFK